MINKSSVSSSSTKEEEKKNFEVDTADLDVSYINNSVASYMY
jgi:hypothetical protein